MTEITFKEETLPLTTDSARLEVSVRIFYDQLNMETVSLFIAHYPSRPVWRLSGRFWDPLCLKKQFYRYLNNF